jgi:hypothetical protein
MNPPKPAATPKPARKIVLNEVEERGADSGGDHLDKPKQAGTPLPVTKEELKDLANDAEGG